MATRYSRRRVQGSGAILPTTVEEYIDARVTAGDWVLPHRFKFNESTATITAVDDGSQATSPPHSQHADSVMSNASVTTHADNTQLGVAYTAASSRYTLLTAGTQFFNTGPGMTNIGAVFLFFKRTVATTLVDLLDCVMTVGTTPRLTLSIQATTGKLYWTDFYTASSNGLQTFWHTNNIHTLGDVFVAIVQRGDGTGLHCFVNGVEDTNVSTSVIGAGGNGVNGWFRDHYLNPNWNSGNSRIILGALGRPVTSYMNGTVDHLSWVDGHVSDAQIAAMQALR